jgi:hypothetical protein
MPATVSKIGLILLHGSRQPLIEISNACIVRWVRRQELGSGRLSFTCSLHVGKHTFGCSGIVARLGRNVDTNLISFRLLGPRVSVPTEEDAQDEIM